MTEVLATGNAAAIAGANVLSGWLGRRHLPLAIMAVTAPVGLLVALASTLVLPGMPTPGGLAAGAAAGLLGGAALPLAYRLYRQGPIAVVTPVIAIATASVLVVAGVVTGGVGPAEVVGLGACAAAVVLVSDSRRGEGGGPRASLVLTILVGSAFGGFGLLLGLAPADSGTWPLAAARASTLLVAVLVIAARWRGPGLGPIPWTPVAVLAGVLDVGANLLLVVALASGEFATVGVIGALSPVFAVLFARLLLAERLTRRRLAGLVLAVAGLSVVSL